MDHACNGVGYDAVCQTLLARLPLFFVLSKTLGYLLLPTNFLIGVGLVGAMLMFTRFASLGRKLVIAAVLLLVICGLSPLGKILLYPLEQRFPPWDAARARLTASSCSAASIEADLSVAHDTPVVRGAPDRIIAAAALAKRYPNARVLFSGGSANLISNDAREADFAGAHLRKPRRRQIAADHGTAHRATPMRTPNSPRRWSSRSRASDGCW